MLRGERNMKIHGIFACLAIVACISLGVTKVAWIHVLLLIGMVFCAEAINTCIEELCNIVSPQYHPLVKKIKDIAAGMVLLTAIIAVIIGVIIFSPYLYPLF